MAELPVRQRLDSVDLVRGAVMVIMALDHTRGAWSDASFEIMDVRITTVALGIIIVLQLLPFGLSYLRTLDGLGFGY